MDDDKYVNLDYAFKYFIDFKETPDHVYFEHAYNQPSHKKYHGGYLNPAKYLFTVPLGNPVAEISNGVNNEHVDVETVDHSLPLFYNSVKMNEQVTEAEEKVEYEDNWLDKVDYRDWNVVKNRLFRSAVQVLEADYFTRLVHKGLRDEAVKRHLMMKKTASRLKRIYGSVAWEPYTAQWLHNFLLDKLPTCHLKVYTDAFQYMETKVPSHLLEHMPIPSSSSSVRSRFLNPETPNTQKKSLDLFSSAIAQHKPRKILGEPLLVLVPTSMGNSFQPNTRPFRLMSELSLLGTLITVTVPKSSSDVELPTLLEQMINATVTKVIEIQTDYPARPIILVGMDAGSLLACHIALGFSTKITAVVCIGFSIFTIEGKVGKANDKLLKLRTPLLFIIGQNATRATIDEVEEFRGKLQCKSGLIVVGGADDHLRVNHFLKMKCSVTQNIVDRCILNEIAEFLNDVIQPPKVVVSIISSSDASKTTATVSPAEAQLLKQIFRETVKKSRTAILKKTVKSSNSASFSQLDHEYETAIRLDQATNLDRVSPKLSVHQRLATINKQPDYDTQKRSSHSDEMTNHKKSTSPHNFNNETSGYHRIEFSGNPSTSFTYQVVGLNRKSPINSDNITRLTSPPVFARKTRGGRRPYVRRTIPPKRSIERTVVLSSYSSMSSNQDQTSNVKGKNEKETTGIENLTPDSLLDLPIVFADENDEDNVINDVSLTSYEP